MMVPEVLIMMSKTNLKVDSLNMVTKAKNMSMECLFCATGALFEVGFP